MMSAVAVADADADAAADDQMDCNSEIGVAYDG